MSSTARRARINAFGTATPPTDVDREYRRWAERTLPDARDARLFARMTERSGIDHRWSVLGADASLEAGRFYTGDAPPGTAQRMAIYAREAPKLALEAIRKLGDPGRITHLVVASCTGFIAPGIDQVIARELGLAPDVERLLVGFMGCYAGATALRTAGQLACAGADARVLVVCVELCSLHLQETDALEPALAMAQFSDGAAAAIVSTQGPGLAIGESLSAALPASEDLITWTIGDTGFGMTLSGEVPARLAEALGDDELRERVLGGLEPGDIGGWAVHPGGRSILDAVERAFDLAPDCLAESRAVLRECGNMSSATVLFVLARIFDRRPRSGVALAFGPGLAMEGFRFGWVDGDAG